MNEMTFRFTEFPLSMKSRLESMGCRVQIQMDDSWIISSQRDESPFETRDQLRAHLDSWIEKTMNRIEEI